MDTHTIYCHICKNKCYDEIIRFDQYYNILRYCSLECVNIADYNMIDRFCNQCSNGTGTYICNNCIIHTQNEDTNVTCAICQIPYDTDFKIKYDLDKYVCKGVN